MLQYINPMDALYQVLLDNAGTVEDILAIVTDVRCGLECRTTPNDLGGCTPLMLATYVGHIDAMEALLAAGADANAQDTKSNRAPLHIAATMGNRPAIEVLMAHGVNVDILQEGGYTPLHYAASLGHTSCVEILITALRMDEDSRIPLHRTTSTREESGVCPEARVANVNAMTEYGESPLHLASEKGHAACVELLNAQGADVKAVDDYNCSSLSKAAQFGHTACVELLLSNGADVNVTDSDGCSILYYAVDFAPSCVELLLANGADVDLTNKNGTTALDAAVLWEDEECVALLTANGSV